MPNRYEVARGRVVHTAYVAGPLRAAATAPFQDMTVEPELAAEALAQRFVFCRPLNPHSAPSS